jgi:hypothetical protein
VAAAEEMSVKQNDFDGATIDFVRSAVQRRAQRRSECFAVHEALQAAWRGGAVRKGETTRLINDPGSQPESSGAAVSCEKVGRLGARGRWRED